MKFCIATFASALFACATFAATPKAELEETAAVLKEQEAKASKLSKENEKITKELDQLQAQSRKMVSSIRKQQDRIESNRGEIRRLSQAQNVKRKELASRREEIGTLLHGMIRLRRLPQHYAAARPGSMQTLLHTASALDVTYGAVQKRFEAIQQEYQALEELSATLEHSQKSLNNKLASVQKDQQKLQQTVRERRDLQQRLSRDHAKVVSRVKELSDKSGDLQELIARLESETLLFKNVGAPTPKPKDLAAIKVESFSARKGGIAYPAAGHVLHRYGEKRKGSDERYQGALLKTPSEAPVTAPHAGKVVFSGSFMDYGPMVILEHDKTYHSVIAGLDIVAVEPGQNIARGDLVGTMGASDETQRLYFELRKHSKAIDPEPWIGNVSLAARN